MKNYKVTNRGKILLTTYFIAMVGSYLLNPLIFYVLSGVLVILLGVETINYLMNAIKNRPSRNETNDTVKIKPESFEKDTKIADAGEKKQQEIVEELSQDKSTEAPSILPEKETDYDNAVDDFDSIEEDLESMTKDLEVIGKKATVIHQRAVENYYDKKKHKIANNNTDNSDQIIGEVSQNFEEESLLDTIVEKFKEFFSFRKYKEGNLVLHNHFGIGKIIDLEDTLKVSFINDQMEEVIEFEYDKNNKIPELNLFKAPKGEDERQYYYNYKRDVSENLLNTIEKIDLTCPDIKYQWNVFLKSGDTFETYDFIAISDQVHVFSKKDQETIQYQLLENLLGDFEIDIKKHEISDYPSINSILLKSKIKGIMSLEAMDAVNQRVIENNIKDFNERMMYSNKIEGLEN
jgi:hypothetical protein